VAATGERATVSSGMPSPATNESNRELTNRLTRQSYPFGIIVNTSGERFLDEGADFRNYTYAKYGKEILKQPGSVAYQIFDATLRPMLRTEEYDMPGISVEVADTLEELATKIGIDPERLSKTVSDFNNSIDRSITFDPNIKDGRAAATEPVKSNWAAPIETGPFYAYGVTCGITFTFGGIKSDTHGRVLDGEGKHIQGLYVAGEMLGGLFSANYPGGSGLAAGCVFGRRAGTLA
jgi:tricarballylate dehydrogenase